MKSFIFAGEPSGDLHGGNLVKALKEKEPGIRFEGVCGPAMREAGVVEIAPMEQFCVMGFSDVFKALPRLARLFFRLKRHVLKSSPDLILFIDYPGFNLRMAAALRKAGYKGKLVHYISPSVWAWGSKRIEKMAGTLDMLLTIYPFEEKYFLHSGLKTVYVGHPLQDKIASYAYQSDWRQSLALHENDKLVAIFPGSRKSEIAYHFPLQIKALELFQRDFSDIAIGISCRESDIPSLKAYLNESTLERQKIFFIPHRHTYELIKECDFAIAKSGTITLELALHGKPTVVIYYVNRINRFIAKHIFKISLPYYCIVNILTQKRTFPELIERGLSPENIYLELRELKENRQAAASCLQDCREVQRLFCDRNPSQNAAKEILELMQCSAI